MNVRISQTLIDSLNALDIVSDLLQPVQQIKGTCVMIPVVGIAAIFLQKIDPAHDIHDVISHFFIMKNIIEYITSVLDYIRICGLQPHHIVDIDLLCLLVSERIYDRIHPQIMNCGLTQSLIFLIIPVRE